MEKYLGKVCLLDNNYLNQVYEADGDAANKIFRPYLIIKLDYKGSGQYFAVPLQSNVKTSLNDDFWEPLPSRLETRQKMKQGLLFAKMVPVNVDCIHNLFKSDRGISESVEWREKIAENIISRSLDSVEFSLQPDLALMKKQILTNGINTALQNNSFKSAYINLSAYSYKKTLEKINKGLSLNENGKRPFVEKAQNYLNRYIESAAGKAVPMPNYYTNINKLIGIANQFKQAPVPQSNPQTYRVLASAFIPTEKLKVYGEVKDKQKRDCYLIKLPLFDKNKPEEIKQPIPLPKDHFTIRNEAGVKYVVAASQILIDKVAALNKNIQIPKRQNTH